MTPTREQIATLRELADDLDSIVEVVSTRDGDATARQHARANAVRAALSCFAALTPPAPAPMPPIEPGDWVKFDGDWTGPWEARGPSENVPGRVVEIRKANGTVWVRP